MSRAILFKAKCFQWDNILEGSYVLKYARETNTFIHYLYAKADPALPFGFWCIEDINTLCQFTGLLDKNGKKIFEWDILKNCNEDYFVCFYNSNKALFNLYFYNTNTKTYCVEHEIDINILLNSGLEIIGNIHDTERTQ